MRRLTSRSSRRSCPCPRGKSGCKIRVSSRVLSPKGARNGFVGTVRLGAAGKLSSGRLPASFSFVYTTTRCATVRPALRFISESALCSACWPRSWGRLSVRFPTPLRSAASPSMRPACLTRKAPAVFLRRKRCRSVAPSPMIPLNWTSPRWIRCLIVYKRLASPKASGCG